MTKSVILCNSITEPIFKKMYEDWYNKKEGEPHVIGWKGGEPVFSEDIDLTNQKIRKHNEEDI